MLNAAVLFLLPLVAGAQLTPNSITVTATRTTVSTPDQVNLLLAIDAPVDATREEALAAVANLGLNAANFASVWYASDFDPYAVQWSFSWNVPVSQLQAKIAAITALQQSLMKGGRFRLSFTSTPDESVQTLQARSCSLTDLLSDARAQATKLANAAGATVGAVQAILGGTAVTTTTSSGIGGPSAVAVPICTVTVKFVLGGL